MPRIAIVGVGAIGGVTAALLQQAGGHELFLCTRRPLSTLSVETPDGLVYVHAVFATDPAEVPSVDWVLVATKAYDVAGAAKWLEGLCSQGAPVAVCRTVSSTGNDCSLSADGEDLPVMVDCPAERSQPERVRQRGSCT